MTTQQKAKAIVDASNIFSDEIAFWQDKHKGVISDGLTSKNTYVYLCDINKDYRVDFKPMVSVDASGSGLVTIAFKRKVEHVNPKKWNCFDTLVGIDNLFPDLEATAKDPRRVKYGFSVGKKIKGMRSSRNVAEKVVNEAIHTMIDGCTLNFGRKIGKKKYSALIDWVEAALNYAKATYKAANKK